MSIEYTSCCKLMRGKIVKRKFHVGRIGRNKMIAYFRNRMRTRNFTKAEVDAMVRPALRMRSLDMHAYFNKLIGV